MLVVVGSDSDPAISIGISLARGSGKWDKIQHLMLSFTRRIVTARSYQECSNQMVEWSCIPILSKLLHIDPLSSGSVRDRTSRSTVSERTAMCSIHVVLRECVYMINNL